MALSQKYVHMNSDPHTISVQELMKQQPQSIPQNFVISSDPPPPPTQNPNHHILLPTIDMNHFSSPEKFHHELHNLHSACKNWGFFQVVNHGVSPEMTGKLKEEFEGFFKLPLEEKMRYEIRAGENEGYGSVLRDEGKLDWADRLYMFTNPLQRRRPHLFPQLPSSLRTILETYLKEMQELGMELLRLVSKALEVKETEMMEIFDNGLQSMKMTTYPPCPQPELVVGITPHTDATAITILNQVNEVDGLQIRKDGIWYPVRFLPNALLVNVGDILEILSNGIYESIEHKVAVNSEKERMSMAFFILPKPEAEIGPLPSLISPENAPLYKSVAMEDYVKGFFSQKLKGKTYLETMRVNHKQM